MSAKWDGVFGDALHGPAPVRLPRGEEPEHERLPGHFRDPTASRRTTDSSFRGPRHASRRRDLPAQRLQGLRDGLPRRPRDQGRPPLREAQLHPHQPASGGHESIIQFLDDVRRFRVRGARILRRRSRSTARCDWTARPGTSASWTRRRARRGRRPAQASTSPTDGQPRRLRAGLVADRGQPHGQRGPPVRGAARLSTRTATPPSR